MTWILKAKGYLYAAVGIALSLIALMLRGKVLKHQRDSARGAADYYKAQAQRQVVLQKAKKKNKETFRSRRAKAKAEINETGTSEHLANPNDGWLRDDDRTD